MHRIQPRIYLTPTSAPTRSICFRAWQLGHRQSRPSKVYRRRRRAGSRVTKLRLMLAAIHSSLLSLLVDTSAFVLGFVARDGKQLPITDNRLHVDPSLIVNRSTSMSDEESEGDLPLQHMFNVRKSNNAAIILTVR